MHTNHPLLKGFRLATIFLAVAVFGTLGIAVFRDVPTSSLSGRLLPPQKNGETPIVVFDEKRFMAGFSAPSDTQVFFSVPAGVRITRLNLLGGPVYDRGRYWGYVFSGREQKNKDARKTGRDLYDGHFFFSSGERQAQRKDISREDLIGLLERGQAGGPKASEIDGPRTVYLMIDGKSAPALPVGPDGDLDGLNDQYERLSGSLPDNADTDYDGIADGIEVLVTRTSALLRDTDNDGLSDGCEDKNNDGVKQSDETSPNNVDSDRDGLCDGGDASGCPEGGRAAVKGEDINHNCAVDSDETDPTKAATYGGLNDWTYKWNKLQEAKKK